MEKLTLRVFDQMVAVQIYIGQTYRKITLRLRSMSTDNSHSLRGPESECTSAGIFSQDFDHPKLQYTWTRQELCGEGALFLKRDNARLFIEGNYSSNHPRVGFMRLTRKETRESWDCGLLQIIQTSEGERYLGIHIPESDVIPYLKEMRSYLSAENYSVYTENQSRKRRRWVSPDRSRPERIRKYRFGQDFQHRRHEACLVKFYWIRTADKGK